ncbi:MAG: VCBS repeat-containing protein [Bacteroidetes bacterium]|nr:VCBS repeat-containing protein [Bacteroidota bacterium]
MKRYMTFYQYATAGFLLMLAFFLPQLVLAQAPTLGTYPNSTVQAGQQVTISPSPAPANTTRAVAIALNFMGVLQVNPTTGAITVTDAERPGTYLTKVWAYGPGGVTSTTFQITVSNPSCSQGRFVNGTSVTGLNNPVESAVGDFNQDGKQDIAVANSGSNNVLIRIGVGDGTFTSGSVVSVDQFPDLILGRRSQWGWITGFGSGHQNSKHHCHPNWRWFGRLPTRPT